MKRLILRYILPWAVTVAALYFAFRGIDWSRFFELIFDAKWSWIVGAILLTVSSYLLRSLRWLYLFPNNILTYLSSFRVLIIGFLMNNVLPARAGELVRAHLGAQVTKESRALVLATVASERLIDGLTLSLLFIIYASNTGDASYSNKLLLVALLFAAAALTLFFLLFSKNKVSKFLDSKERINKVPVLAYVRNKGSSFLAGLTPLTNARRLPFIVGWSLIIWFVELSVYFCIARAYGESLPIEICVLFMVTVNFSSLIPAAPGGIGVIEAAATAVLVSVGITKEHALTMTLTQHVIQYLVVGIMGGISVLTWKGKIREEE